MAKWVIDSDTLTGIADAVRDQLGTEDTIKVSEIAEKIAEIEGGGGLENYDMSFCQTTDQDTLTFDHTLGATPKAVIFFPANMADICGTESYKIVAMAFHTNPSGSYPLGTGSNKLFRYASITLGAELDENSVIITNTNATYHFSTTAEYICLVC